MTMLLKEAPKKAKTREGILLLLQRFLHDIQSDYKEVCELLSQDDWRKRARVAEIDLPYLIHAEPHVLGLIEWAEDEDHELCPQDIVHNTIHRLMRSVAGGDSKRLDAKLNEKLLDIMTI